MAIAKCRECDASVSTSATTCPGCGAVQPTQGSGPAIFAFGVFALIGVLMLHSCKTDSDRVATEDAARLQQKQELHKGSTLPSQDDDRSIAGSSTLIDYYKINNVLYNPSLTIKTWEKVSYAEGTVDATKVKWGKEGRLRAKMVCVNMTYFYKKDRREKKSPMCIYEVEHANGIGGQIWSNEDSDVIKSLMDAQAFEPNRGS